MPYYGLLTAKYLAVYLFDEYLKYGFVSDKLFKQLGFPMDVDISGREVRRGSNIAQESRQRCKVLTHFHQVKLRQERKTIIQAEVRSKSADKKALLDLRLIDCISCETKMSRLMGKNDTCEQSIRTNLTFEIISKCTGDELKYFILSRKFDLPKSRLSKKGKVADVIIGENNLVTMSYNCRMMPNILRQKIQ